MSIWMTIVLGLAGSFVGGLIAGLLWHRAAGFVFSVLVSTALLYLYRRHHGRGLTGATADLEGSQCMHWIWFIIAGLIVGALGRLVHPGRDPMGLLMTMAVGIVAMIIAAAISSGWIAFVIGVIIA